MSTDNVFADLGFENPMEERLKADLVIDIADVIERRGLSHAAAAQLMRVSPPDLATLLRGRTGSYSLERLLAFTRALGSNVEITIRHSALDEISAGQMNLRVLDHV